MKLSRLYTNHDEIFAPITFRQGLNVIRGEVRQEDLKHDTHNLGRSTLRHVIDFCLLTELRTGHPFKDRPDLFDQFIFFLEIVLDDGQFLTIRRNVSEASKASFVINTTTQNLTDSVESDWRHWRISRDQSLELLDGYLNLDTYKPWTFRNGIGYQLRSQNDYGNVFKLGKHRSKDIDWKPFLAQILGFDGLLIKRQYQVEADKKRLLSEVETLRAEYGISKLDANFIEGRIQIKAEEVAAIENDLDRMDFGRSDREETRMLVEDLDTSISSLNEQIYATLSKIQYVEEALQQEVIEFNPKGAEQLFEDAGIQFPSQIKKSFEQLIEFNKAISDERSHFLRDELSELKNRASDQERQIAEVEDSRSEALAYLGSSSHIEKFRMLSRKQSEVQAQLIVLQTQRDSIQNVGRKEREVQVLKSEVNNIANDVEQHIQQIGSAETEGLFNAIRRRFNHLALKIVNKQALLNVTINTQSHIDFQAFILDDAQSPTREGEGHTYSKLLCIIFDLAMTSEHLPSGYPKFVFHDGFFDEMEPRKKRQMMSIVRECEAEGIQHIITTLDSDAPKDGQDELGIAESEIILRLHDKDQSGLLFKMETW